LHSHQPALGSLEHRQRPGWEREIANRVPRPIHHHEAVAAETECRLLDGLRAPNRPGEPVRAATGSAVRFFEVSARDVERGLDVEVAFAVPKLMKRDVAGVAEKPRGFMIEGGDSLLEGADPKGHPECSALRAHCAAGRDS